MGQISIPISDLQAHNEDQLPSVAEETIQFRKHTDHMSLSINNDAGETVGQITGYGLEVGFNVKFFKNEEDIQAAANAIAELAVKLIMETVVKQYNENIDKQM